MKIISGIYQILNKINGKSYVGSAVDIEARWWHHHSDFRLGKNSRHLQNAWNKYGEQAWKWNVLEYVSNLELLIEVEQHWIDFLETANENFGYNICPIAGSSLGVKRSEETRKKMSNANKGKILSDDHKKKLSEANKGRKKVHSEETKKKISETLKGHKHSEETKIKIGKASKGKILSEEHKNKISKAQKGKKYSLGYKQTEEHKNKIKEAKINKKATKKGGFSE